VQGVGFESTNAYGTAVSGAGASTPTSMNRVNAYGFMVFWFVKMIASGYKIMLPMIVTVREMWM